ncbi:alpha/beta hydrolase fold protein [Xylariaceae sp. FL0804]|nr:alpha/beta hydrolase fold protein [Xylariaceae sp. FL0804]
MWRRFRVFIPTCFSSAPICTPSTMQEQKIETEFGTLWTACSEPQASSKSKPAILFLHGSAASSRMFEPLLDSTELNTNYKLVVFDFPGHGRSSDAPDPNKSYYQYAYAEAALEVLRHHNITHVIILGWSLGGHVALELVSVLANTDKPVDIRISSIMITGTPPVPKQSISGFRKDADLSALFNPEAPEEDLIKVASVFTKSAPPAWLVEDVLRTNRLTGGTMATKFMEGHCSDQIKIIHDFKGWIAVVNGGSDPILDLDYCDSVCKGAPRLWRGECIRLKDAGHAPFFDDPQGFLTVFLGFLGSCRM